MNFKTAIPNICLAVLIPLSATAKPPVPGDCELFVASGVNPDMPFTVTVARGDAYPGQWLSPTVMVEIDVPLQEPSAGVVNPNPVSYSQNVTQTLEGLGLPNTVDTKFVIPELPNLVSGGSVNISATISEPLNKNKQTVTAICENNTTLVF